MLVEKQICASCGADVRSGALFCYSCGGAVSAVPKKQENNNGNGAKTDFSERNNVAPTEFKEITVSEAATKSSGFETTVERRKEETTAPAEAKLKSAAAMRRKPKTLHKKEVEIVWEEQENPSSWLLIAAALVLAIFAAAVVIAALTLK